MRSAVVDDSARFVAEQIRVDIADAERPRAFEDKAMADLRLTECEMARAGIENHVDAAEGQLRTGPIGDPGVLANLEADLHAADVEVNIAERVRFVTGCQISPAADRPGLEPARLIVDAVAGEKPLGGKTENPTVSHQRRRVVKRAMVQHGQPNRDDNSASARHDLFQHSPGGALHGRREKRVFTAVAGDAQLRQAEQTDPLAAGRLDAGDNVRLVRLPRQRSLIQDSGADFQQLHIRRLTLSGTPRRHSQVRQPCSPRHPRGCRGSRGNTHGRSRHASLRFSSIQRPRLALESHRESVSRRCR